MLIYPPLVVRLRAVRQMIPPLVRQTSTGKQINNYLVSTLPEDMGPGGENSDDKQNTPPPLPPHREESMKKIGPSPPHTLPKRVGHMAKYSQTSLMTNPSPYGLPCAARALPHYTPGELEGKPWPTFDHRGWGQASPPCRPARRGTMADLEG